MTPEEHAGVHTAAPETASCRVQRRSGRAQWCELTWILVARNLKIRYKGSALGFFWSLLTPAITILMYAVFAHILKFNAGQEHYLQFLVTGILVWSFTAGSLNDSLMSIAGNSNLVKKVYFPRLILPLSTVLANAVNFALTLIPLFLYLGLTDTLVPSGICWLLPAFLLHLLLCIGIACFVGTANVYFRDTQHIVGVGQLAWFFLTPVFYMLPMQLGVFPLGPLRSAGIVFLNPMTGILALYRKGFSGTPVIPAEAGLSPQWLWLSIAVTLAVFALGLLTLRRGDRGFGDVL